jgi:hypothetical protein
MTKAALVAAIAAVGLVSAQDEKQIWNTYFSRGREKVEPKPGTLPPAKRPQNQYHRVSNGPTPAGEHHVGRALGVTIWRMEKSQPGDTVRLLMLESPEKPKADYTAYRISSTDVLVIGDRVRVTVEAAEGGYLYVVDQETLAGGRLGQPYLIFPVTKVRGGNNRVLPGHLTEIPARTDRIPVFAIRGRGANYTGEKLTFLLSSEPLPGVRVTAEPQILRDADLRSWEFGASRSEDAFELVGGERQAWTTAEDEAGRDPRRLLTLNDPAPQTVFVASGKSGKALLATVLLTVAPSRQE